MSFGKLKIDKGDGEPVLIHDHQYTLDPRESSWPAEKVRVVAQKSARSSGTLCCRVELFGMARLAAGRKQVTLEIGTEATLREVVAALAAACPELVGKAIRPDLAGLLQGHVVNINGVSFAERLDTPVVPGDSVLLLSDQAGG